MTNVNPMTREQVEARTAMWMALDDYNTACQMAAEHAAHPDQMVDAIEELRSAIERRAEVDPAFRQIVEDHGGDEEMMLVLTMERAGAAGVGRTVENQMRATWRRCEAEAFNAESEVEELQEQADRIARKLSAARMRMAHTETRRAMAEALLADVNDNADIASLEAKDAQLVRYAK